MTMPRAKALAIDPDTAWIAAFWAKVDRSGDCWEWLPLSRSRAGYGLHCTKALGIGQKQAYAHRIAYALEVGPIPSGIGVLHRCDNPSCCNPAHLFLGTAADNMQDCARKGRTRNQRRLTDGQVQAIRDRYAAGGITFQKLGDLFGISMQHAHAIVRGVRYERSAA